MADNPNKSKEVPLTGALVKQHHRMAAGEKLNGQTLPAEPSMPKTPA